PKALRHGFATALQDANVDPLVRNALMGHASGIGQRPGAGLGMTAVYTHTRPETVRRQLEAAMDPRPAVAAAGTWSRSARPAVEHCVDQHDRGCGHARTAPADAGPREADAGCCGHGGSGAEAPG